MEVPLTVTDFLARAASVYGDRVGVIDEPDQPAPGWGELTWRRVGELARAQAAGLDALGIGHGERVAVVSQNSARLLTSFFGVSGWGRILVPVNFRLNADEVSYIVDHSGATVLLVDPELDDALSSVSAKHRFVIGTDTDDALLLEGTEPEPWLAPDESATATINYTSGTTARPKGVQLTHRNVWLNATTFAMHLQVSDRDVYLHTLPMFHCNGWGMTYGVTGLGGQHVVLRKVDGTEILRRVEQHGVTLLCGAPAVVAAVLDAAAEWDGPIPGRDRVRIVVAGAPPPTRTRPRPRPHRRRRRAAADADHRAGRDRARLAVQPDLRPHGDGSAAHRQPPSGRVGRPLAGGAGRQAVAGGRANARRADPHRRSGRGAGPVEPRARRLLGAARRDGRRHRRRLVPHR